MKDPNTLKSLNWLRSIQNKDGGWGMYDYDPSRIVTSAEAVTALAIANVHDKYLTKGVEYLIESAKRPDWCQYNRHHAWIIYALTRAGYKDQIPDRCIQALQRSHNNGGWSHSKEEPSIFATFLAWRALDVYGKSKSLTNRACEWLNSRFREQNCWTFNNGRPSYAATSYAIIALTSQPNWEKSYGTRIEKAIEFLKTGSKSGWQNEHEQSISGDLQYNFHHFTAAWVVMALISAGISAFDPIIRHGINQLYFSNYSNATGGWSEEETHRPSVFGTSHTIAALEVFIDSIGIESYLGNINSEQKILNKLSENAVFVVHGHDAAAKLEVARFLEKIECKPILLEETVNSGVTTIFQKFTEHASRASYAIVLMTPDDLAKDKLGLDHMRARQNVVLELGFFIGMLGSEKVCLAKKGNIEFPSDISGVLYLDLDDGGWKLSLASKLKVAGLHIDSAKLI